MLSLLSSEGSSKRDASASSIRIRLQVPENAPRSWRRGYRERCTISATVTPSANSIEARVCARAMDGKVPLER